jgi:hypothetical protein
MDAINYLSVKYVHQGDAIIISNPLPDTLLLTSNLHTCIGIAVFNKKAQIIGLGHVDINRSVESIVSFISQMRSSKDESLEVLLSGGKMRAYYSAEEVSIVSKQIDAVLKQIDNVKVTRNIFEHHKSGITDTLAIDGLGRILSSENFYVAVNNPIKIDAHPHGSVLYKGKLTELLIPVPHNEYFLDCFMGRKVELRVKKIDELPYRCKPAQKLVFELGAVCIGDGLRDDDKEKFHEKVFGNPNPLKELEDWFLYAPLVPIKIEVSGTSLLTETVFGNPLKEFGYWSLYAPLVPVEIEVSGTSLLTGAEESPE